MASNSTHTVTSVATDRNRAPLVKNPPKRRRTSLRSQFPEEIGMGTSTDPHAALMQGHDHDQASERSRHLLGEKVEETEEAQANKSKRIQKMITPYLAEHIPQQYNPTGGANSTPGITNTEPVNTKFCYRHRPDKLCRRQADEPTMEQLQQDLGKESQADQQSIANVWSLFSAAPARHRNLMLQGILTQCCFPQLSFIASSVRNLIKIDFINALPHELGFKILSYLDTTSLCKAAQVSRKWRQLADDDVVWHKMCEQHIDRKCTKCGWGLPLLDRARLRQEKRRIQLRASGRGINEWSPNVTPVPETEADPTTLVHRHSDHSDSSETTTGTKRSAPSDSLSPEISAKRSCTESATGEARDQLASYFDQPKKRPWKDVYKDRFRVGINWKHGRYSTTTLTGHTNGVMSLQFDDQTLITGSYDATIKVWDINTGKEIRTLTGHTAGIRCLQFDDSKLITGSLDRTIKVWNWRTGQLVRTLHGHTDGVIGLHLAGSLLASGSSDHTIMVHDFQNSKRITLRGHTDWVNSVKIDLASRTLFSASDDMTVKLWDLDTYEVIKTYEGHVGQVQQVLPLPHDFEIDEDDFNAAANTNASDAASQAPSDNEDAQSATVTQEETVFPNDPSRPKPPSYMLTGSLDGTIRLWHVPSGRCVHRFFGHVEGVWSLAADSLRVVSGAEDKTIKIWDPRTGTAERTMAVHEGPVTCVGLSDERLVSGSEDGTVKIHCFTKKYDD